MKEKIIKFLIDKAKRSKLVQSVFEQPLDMKTFPVKGTFTDTIGYKHILYDGFRTKIKPGWERIFEVKSDEIDTSAQKVTKRFENGKIAVDRIEPMINLYSKGIKDSNILEIGCFDGGVSYAFADRGAKHVVGTEYHDYKVDSVDSKKDIQKLKRVDDSFAKFRNLVGERFNRPDKVSFENDDICDTKLQAENFDIICSWDVLEHLHDPLAAFKNISKLLTKDGVAINEYNPFFSLPGGHSACTIDFPWGHVLLNEDDFHRFNKEMQPDRLDTAMSFYKNGINRMTIEDLINYSEEANLEILSIIAFPKEQHLRMLSKEMFEMAKSNYPKIKVNDLITQRLIVIHRKK